jgi:hypothetical protein
VSVTKPLGLKDVKCIPNCEVDHLGRDVGTIMSELEQRAIAETLFERGQTHEQIKDALRLEEERRATLVKNLYRLRALRLSRERGGKRKLAEKSSSAGLATHLRGDHNKEQTAENMIQVTKPLPDRRRSFSIRARSLSTGPGILA